MLRLHLRSSRHVAQWITVPHVHDSKSSSYRHEPQARRSHLHLGAGHRQLVDHADEDDSSIASAQQQYQAVQEKVRAAIQGLHRNTTRLLPNPATARTVPTGHDWDFFYHSLLAAPETRSAILTTKSSGKKPVLKSELRTQRAPTHRQEATCNASRHTEAAQRQCNRRHQSPGDDHARERTQ